MQESINDINQDLEHIWKLMSKYPYLANNLNQIADELTMKKKELEKENLNNLKDLKDYQGEDFNRIEETDDIGVIQAKLLAQQQWINSHK